MGLSESEVRDVMLRLHGLASVVVLATMASVLSGCALLGMGGDTYVVRSGDIPSAPPVRCCVRATADPILLGSWTANPTTPDPAFLAAARDRCFEGMGDAAASVRDAEPIQDQRGPHGAAFLWTEPTGTMVCLVTDEPGFLWVSQAGWQGGSDVPPTLGLGSFADAPPYLVYGWVDPRAVTAEIPTRHGMLIHAPVHDGRFVAWWPQPDAPLGVRPLDADGRIVPPVP